MKDPPPLPLEHDFCIEDYLNQDAFQQPDQAEDRQGPSTGSNMDASVLGPILGLTGARATPLEPQAAGANGPPEYRIPNFGMDHARSFPSGRQRTTSPPPFAIRNYHAMPRGSTNDNEALQAVPQVLDERSRFAQAFSESQYQHHPPRYYSHSEVHRVPMQQASHPPPQVEPCAGGTYAPFSGAFRDGASASAYRKAATRFNRQPYRSPDSDFSIQELINDRQTQVKRIYDAMIRPDAAKDNSNSIAMRRWVHQAFYSPKTVESFAHKVFDNLIEQAKEGFRGWAHNDYASDERKGEIEDKEVSCSERLNNIIKALEEEKTICEDVMTSACQIRMFVNAPRAYARRKEANRHGNSKRGRAKDPPARADTSSRVTKTRRANARSTNRSRQVTPLASSPLQLPIPEDRRQHQMPPLPYYPTQRIQPAPVAHMSPFGPGQTLGFPDSRNYTCAGPPRHVTSQSPPEPHTNTPRFTAVPPGHHMALLSPPSATSTPAPVTPNEQLPAMNAAFHSPWPHADTFGFHPGNQPPQETALFGPNLFNFGSPSSQSSRPMSSGPPQAHGVPLPPHSMAPNDDNIDPAFRFDHDFQSFWNNQLNVQPFPQSSADGQPPCKEE